jgi:hypothetical protein
LTTAVNQQSVNQPEPAAPSAAAEAAPLAWLTLEVALYAAIFALALALRLWDVGVYPLSNAEALQALAAFSIYHGDFPAADLYSPLLASLNTLTFFLLGDSVTTARLATVMLGLALVLLPLTLRRQLGQKASLLAAGLLAISPSAVLLSRTVTGETATALGALMIVSGFFNWAEDGHRRWLYLLAGGLALLLTAGPLSFTVLIAFALPVAVKWRAFKTLWSQATERAAGPALRNAAIFLAVALVALGTAATLNLSGLGVTTSLFSDWLGRFSFAPQADAGFNGVFLLTIYEPLLVIAGLVGLSLALLSKDLLRHSFVGWFAGVLLLDLLMAGRPAGAVLLLTVPLAFLAAIALAELWAGLAQRGARGNEGIIVGAGLVIAVFGYIGLTGWIVRPCDAGNTLCELAWLQPVASVALFLVIAAFFGYMGGFGAALRGAALTGVIIGVIATLGFGWRVSHGPLARQAFQPLAGVPVSTELAALQQTLTSESLLRTGDNATLDVGLVGDVPPAVQWLLRNFEARRQVASPLEMPEASAFITPVFDETDLNLGDAYLGQDFAVDAVWSPVGLSSKDLGYWLVYRELPVHPAGSDSVILWLRAGQPNF